jgi:Lon protease-like protein
MFPLGSVLVPHMLLPLRIFEPRYLDMFAELGPGDEFGVVLIERGFEVGGDDQRFSVGSIAQVIEISDLDEPGHRLVLSAGTDRIRVVEWLPDDPYPRARVERLSESDPQRAGEAEVGRLRQSLRRAFGLMSELGYDVGTPETDLADDARIAGFQAMILAPLSMMDRQQLLEMEDVDDRLEALQSMLDAQVDVFGQQLASG